MRSHFRFAAPLLLLLGCGVMAVGPFDSSPLHASGSTECALIIPGVGKSSAFDHTLSAFNQISGSPYEGSGTCVTFEAVDYAFNAARTKVSLPRPKRGALTSAEIGQLGAVLLETTRILANQYGLPKDVVINGLPLIDTTKTSIRNVCPSFLLNPKCEVKRYREYNGLCNNIEHPHWGASRTPFKRRLSPRYADGLQAPRASVDGYPLPSARTVSSLMHRDEGHHDHAVTVLLVAWGQAIDHDITLTGETKDPRTNKEPECCDQPPHVAHPDCLPIEISSKDAFFRLFNRKCMSFIRSLPAAQYGCKLGPRLQFNVISSSIDANWVYGSSKEESDRLRSFKHGQLKTLPVFTEFGLKDLLPLKTDDADDGCIRPRKDIYCFLAGDNRVNEQLVLAVIHTMYVREHNHMARELSHINPHWDDETIYQESRHIMAAIIQHITYNEFLPMVLGKEIMHKYDLILQKEGYFGGYDPNVNPSASANFITAAFRFGHSLLPSTIERWSTTHKYIASQRLSEMLRQPYDLFKGGWCDQYMCGLMNQVAQAMDDAVTQEVTNHLFQEPDRRFGMDLAALNIQRGREHGIPGYNDFRELCGLGRVRDFSELLSVMTNNTVYRYTQIYKHPDDIDLWSAGVSERPLPGSMVGPTFGCLIGLQFRDLRFGDRFWYENAGWPSSFTVEQLQEIRKIKLSRVMCDNSDKMESAQVYSMVLPDNDINPRVQCNSGVLPRLDLTKWRDIRQYGGQAASPPVGILG